MRTKTIPVSRLTEFFSDEPLPLVVAQDGFRSERDRRKRSHIRIESGGFNATLTALMPTIGRSRTQLDLRAGMNAVRYH